MTDPRPQHPADGPTTRVDSPLFVSPVLVEVQPVIRALRCLRWSLFALAALVGVGCRCGADEHKPYTPFGVASSAEAPTAVADAAAMETTEKPFAPRAAERFEPAQASLELQGKAVRAPAGQLISQALVLQTRTQDALEPPLLVWLVPEERAPTAEPGALWRWGGNETEPQKLTGFPQFVPAAPECAIDVDLTQTGPRTVTLDVAARCPAGGIPRAPTRSVHLLRLDGARSRTLQHLRLADPPTGETLNLAVETVDQDGDGHDDAKVTFTLRREGTSHESSASLLWLDRAAGPARDDSEPKKSFEDIGSIEVVRSKGQNTSAHVAERVDNARRLHAYLCKESGTHRVSDGDGVPIQCGELARAFTHFRLAELRAALTQDRFGAAISVLDRADWYGPKPSADELSKLKQELFTRLPRLTPQRTSLRIRARADAPEPRRSPLAFDPAGRLLVQSAVGIARLEEGEGPVDVSEQLDPWPLIVFSGAGRQTTGLSFPCDDTVVSVLARSTDGRLAPALATDWLSPRPGACGAALGFRRPELRVVHWQGDELVAVIGAELFGGKPRAPLGGPLSPDGQWRVHTTSVGLFVVGPSERQLWSAAGDERECVIANGGARVACLTDANPVLLTRPAAPATGQPASAFPSGN